MVLRICAIYCLTRKNEVKPFLWQAIPAKILNAYATMLSGWNKEESHKFSLKIEYRD